MIISKRIRIRIRIRSKIPREVIIIHEEQIYVYILWIFGRYLVEESGKVFIAHSRLSKVPQFYPYDSFPKYICQLYNISLLIINELIDVDICSYLAISAAHRVDMAAPKLCPVDTTFLIPQRYRDSQNGGRYIYVSIDNNIQLTVLCWISFTWEITLSLTESHPSQNP